MGFPTSYDPAEAEPRHQAAWAAAGIYQFDPADTRPIFAIDTPPPTVSGEIHIGHVYSYVQAEAMVRFQRMRGHNIFYPFGFDDNGLPTERFVERSRGIRARDVGRAAFVAACLETSAEVEERFEQFWKRLGMGVDWQQRYSTIDPEARRIAQWSFIDLHRRGLIRREQAPNPWCVECETAVAQAETDDVARRTTFYTLAFGLDGGARLPIATTRPELLPACVAVFVHPDDARYAGLIGQEAALPLLGRRVPILADPTVDPAKGSGAVMCCTFGDAADVRWWREHRLPLIPLVSRQGRLGEAGGGYAGMRLHEARAAILADLRAAGLLLAEQAAEQTVRVHERCETPLEILETSQWFVRLLDAKEALLAAGRQIRWHPEHMRVRYEHWVQNLSWDWCISRQRFYGVPFPAWHCRGCGATVLAEQNQLPVDPQAEAPPRACPCGGELAPDEDVMDTWATSSLSPQIAGKLFADPELYRRLFPMQLRPQAHDIIRTWSFYTIARAHLHFGAIPWETLMISGHALDPSGRKFAKSKNNAPVTPLALIERHGADAVRYWACSAGLGADQPLSEERMRQGRRLATKLWNAARFAQAAGGGGQEAGGAQPLGAALPAGDAPPAHILLPTDRWLLSALQGLIEGATARWQAYDYAGALELTERFFWGTLCDQYLELAKGRLYDGGEADRDSARATLALAFEAILKLLAPVMPHITEEIYGHLFPGRSSLHTAAWPAPRPELRDGAAEAAGAALLALAAAVRRHKSGRGLSLGAPLTGLSLSCADPELRAALAACEHDLRSVSRASRIAWADEPGEGSHEAAPGLWLAIEG